MEINFFLLKSMLFMLTHSGFITVIFDEWEYFKRFSALISIAVNANRYNPQNKLFRVLTSC